MTKKILLADDSVTIQKIVELAFVQNGYEVHAVGSGDDALARLDGLEPHVVIADVHMPGASGYDVCRAAKERYPGIPVVLLIGAFELFDPAEVAACGADTSIKKPFDSKDLFATVEGLIADREVVADETAAAGEPALPEPAAAAVPEPELQPAPLPVEAKPDDRVAELAVAAVGSASGDAGSDSGRLSDEDVDRIAHRVVELLGERDVREVAWEVIPDLAEIVIKDRIRELESQVE